MRYLILLAIVSIILVGCTTGVVPMGQNTYMISGSSPGLIGQGAVKAKLLQQADKWCRSKGLVMIPLDSTGHDAVYMGNWANAEVTFKALPPEQAQTAGPVYRPPSVIIENRYR
jgi:hypothetical protein